MHVPIHRAKAELTKLISAAERGEPVVLTRHGQPVVALTPIARTGGFDFSPDDPLRVECGLPMTPRPVGDVNDEGLSRTVLGLSGDE